MSHNKRWLTLTAAAVMVALSVTMVMWAAPVGGGKPPLPDEVRCLGRIDKLAIEVRRPFEPLLQAGLTEDAVRQRVKEHLIEAGVEVVDDPKFEPRLVVASETTTDPDAPEKIFYNVFFELYMRVQIPRLEDQAELTIPTASILTHDVRPVETAVEGVMAEIDFCMKHFLRFKKLADDQ